MQIRPSQPDDMVQVTDIYRHVVVHGSASFEIDPPDTDEMIRRRDALVGAGFPYLVADENKMICGYAYIGAYRPRAAYRFAVEDSIYIAPQMHRRGIGRALLTRLIADSEAAGFRQMIAVIGDSRQAASIAVHRACGFKDAGVFEAVGFKFGRWLDTVQMQRALGEGSGTAP